MDRKTFTIILAIALIACFFLAYWDNISGLDFIKGPGDWKKYILLLIPLSGVLLLFGAMNGNYIPGRGLLSWLPLLTLLYFLILLPLINEMAIKDVFKQLGKGYGIGLWVTIVASVLLAFYNPRPR